MEVLNKAISVNIKKFSVSFWLDISIEILIKRLKKNTQRPLLLNKNIAETVKKIYFERKKIYNKADYRIKCNSLKPNEISIKILNLYDKFAN